MNALYQDILGNETEFFLLEAGYRAWSGLKKIGSSVKEYFGRVGLFLGKLILGLVLFGTFPIWIFPTLWVYSYVKKLFDEVPQAAKSAIEDDFRNINWEDLKILERRVEMLIVFFKGMQRGMRSSSSATEDNKAGVVSVLDHLSVMAAEIKGSYHFKSDTPQIYSAWNQLDDIWDYETPEEDKKMMFEHNKSKRSNDAA